MKFVDTYAQLPYQSSVFFGIDPKGVVCNPNSCRESFSTVFKEGTALVGYYQADGGIPKTFPAFWREVEKRLGLEEAAMDLESLKNAVVMEVDPFWRPNAVRRGFFTMLLRCGIVYPASSFEASLDKYDYTKQAKAAVIYFLEGHTTPTFDEKGLGAGVLSKFRHLNRDAVQPLLVKLITG